MSDQRLIRLQQAVADSNITQVAKAIGLPRCSVSMVVRGKYPANPENVLARFDQVYGGVECPHLGQLIAHVECTQYRQRARPSNPIGLQHWRACQRCAHNPTSQAKT